ncbi:MAG: hypothetical protein ACYC5O_03105 [Anaerolineae bacterium]
MGSLPDLIEAGEQWLCDRVYSYARACGYAEYVPRLAEAWHICIRQLSAILVQTVADERFPDDWDAGLDTSTGAYASYGLVEARRHFGDGTGLDLYLGMLQYFRRAYGDLLTLRELDEPGAHRYRAIINRAFDAVELGFCREWGVLSREHAAGFPTRTDVMALQVAIAIERKQAEEERERLVGELQSALAKVKHLSGLLPICASCKKVRDDRGYWEQIEEYIESHSDVECSHGLCPECLRRLHPDYLGAEGTGEAPAQTLGSG